ncbi:hypothetical protein FS842_000890 [Serendipita sp. 407]|nr:hypothetical protein FS842_000890 [Serendipita sp. 407]
MTIVKSWPVTAFPLSLPVHLTEGSMTTGDIRAAIQRSLALEASIRAARDKKNCYCGSEMIGKRPLSVAEEYPGSMCKNMAYFDGPGLGLFLFDDPNEHRCRFIVLYQISPGRRLAEWDAGEEAEIACWSYTWADLGGPMKQLVVAASLWHPKWVEP